MQKHSNQCTKSYQNNYTQKLEKVIINTEETILLGREQDRKKLSMAAIPLDTNNKKS